MWSEVTWPASVRSAVINEVISERILGVFKGSQGFCSTFFAAVNELGCLSVPVGPIAEGKNEVFVTIVETDCCLKENISFVCIPTQIQAEVFIPIIVGLHKELQIHLTQLG